MYYTYILQSKKDNKWYTGATDDLRKRLTDHNNNLVISTKGRGPFEIIYYEACINKQDAFIREKYLKTGMGKRYIKNRVKRFLSLTGRVQKERVYPVRSRLPKAIVTSNRGIATLEMLIAMALIVFIISAVVPLVSGNQSTSVNSQTNQEALYMAHILLENTRAKAKSDFFNPSLNPGITTSVENSVIDYTKNLTISDIDDFTKQITSDVTWGNTGSYVKLATIVTNWQGVAGGDTCNPTLTGDWTNPQILGKADVGQDQGGTDVDILAKKAYVTTDSASINKDDFYIVDVSNPNLTNLPILGTLHTGPGLASVHATATYAYVANMSTTAQLQVIDVSTPTAPSLVKELDVTALTDTAVGKSVFYSNKRVYLGLTKSNDEEFYVIDVTNPLNPVVIASFEMNTQVSGIMVKDGIAYLAVPDNDDPASTENDQLRVLDVSQADSGTITELDIFGPNPTTMSGQTVYLSKNGNTLYFGEGGANPSNDPQFFVIDVTNPNNVNQLDSKYIDTANDVTVNAVTVRDHLAFMVTSDPNLGFQIWDLDNLGSATPYGSINVEQASTGGMDCEGNFIYIAQRSQRALQIIGPGVLKTDPTISTTIFDDATDLPVTSVLSGTVVYDKATVTGSAGTPTGTVEFELFKNKNDCTGNSDAETQVLASGMAQSSTYTTSNKSISYMVHYPGDANYNPADGPCEPLEVTP